MPAKDAKAQAWDISTDVVVVGFGAAGTCAALAARENGADVVALDRFGGGGATALSGGIIYAGGGTVVQRQAGVTDTLEEFLAYLQLEVGDVVRPETLRRFAESSVEMIDWLSGHGVPFDASMCPYKVSYPNNKYYLYYSGSENSGGFRDVTRPVPRGHRVKGKGASGKKLYGPLAQSGLAKGVRLREHTRVTDLVTDAAGRVVGVQALTLNRAPRWVRQQFSKAASLSAKPGVYYPPLRKVMDHRMRRLEQKFAIPVRVQARRGVILCAGGYIANTDWIQRYAPQFSCGLPLGTSGDDGSGIALAVEAGAVTDRMDNVSAWRFITPPSAFLGSIIVDQDGRRIIDETRYGAATGQAMIRKHGGKGWVLADAELMRERRKQVPVQSIWFQRLQGEGQVVLDAKRGGTLEQVARAAGVDHDGLAKTVAAHNDAIDSGTTDPMGKPAEFTRLVGNGPYTLINISIRRSVLNPTPMLTLGGVRVDEDTGFVVTGSGDPVPGLYAAGRTAVGVCSNSYVSGLSLADCVFSGRRAGAHAAGSSEG
ncbi:MAG: 3-oxo-5alpha-steroid 4-dehydrogenase [Mycobacterium sp.]|jgi:3-oxo-5alpha-steroid 4-dehydrogenase|nr:3-oxo-5alpha-steroid 4-dehydrogenase [Mycobacterium sp.]